MKIGFIGAGNMGSALARAAAKGENEVLIYDKDIEKAAAVARELGAMSAELDSVCECEVVFLGVKPNILASVAEEISGKLNSRPTLVSMAAGVTLDKLGILFPEMPIIRIMPNTPCAVGCGMVVWCKNALADEEVANKLFDAMTDAGEFLKIDEEKIDAATAVSGCGPAFVYMFIDGLIKGGIAAGLSENEARMLAARTAIGAGEMIIERPESPEALRIAVCSPGGSTIEGVKSLFADDFEASVQRAVAASYRRTQELGK